MIKASLGLAYPKFNVPKNLLFKPEEAVTQPKTNFTMVGVNLGSNSGSNQESIFFQRF